MSTNRPQKNPSQTGLSAMFAAFLHLQGIGVSKTARRPRLRLTGATLCMTLGCLVFTAPSASALNTHVFCETCSFGSPGEGAGEVTSPAGVAVNSTTHDVYVADTGNDRVDEFAPELGGTYAFVRAWGWGVADGLPKFEVCELTCQIGSPGSEPGQFVTPTFVAVDNTVAGKGAVYIGDTGDNLVTKFSSTGKLEETWGVKGQLDGETATSPPGAVAGPFGPLAGIAVDSAGGLDVADGGTVKPHDLFQFAQDGSFVTDFEAKRETEPHGLAVDSTGEFFKVNGDKSVEEITSAGEDVGQVSPNGSEGASASGVAAAGDDLYVAEVGHVHLYAFTAPGVVSEPGGSTCTVASFAPCGATESFGSSSSLSGGSGIAVDSSTGDVYVADASTGSVEVFGPEVVLPDVATEPFSGLTARSVTLNGTVDPDEAGEAKCRFEWGTTKGFGHVAACEPEGVASGPSPVPVHAALGGLEPDTEYCYRLQAGNVNGTNLGEASQDRCFTTAGLEPQAGSASAVTSESATLNAILRPGQEPTTYYFQYGTSVGYGSDAPLLSAAAPAGAGVAFAEGAVEVTPQPIHGLSPGTVYHYRVVEVIKSAGGVETLDGPDHTFTTQGADGSTTGLTLADHRQWELVSPASAGAEIFPIVPYAPGTQAAVSGDAMAYVTSAPTGVEPEGNSNFTQVLSSRGVGGWGSRDLAIPHSVGTAFSASVLEYRGVFSGDLSSSVVQPLGPFEPSLSGEASEQTGYLRTDYLGGEPSDFCTSSCYRPLVTGAEGFANVPPGVEFGGNSQTGVKCPPEIVCGPQILAATPDLRHIVFTSDLPLTSTPGDTGHLYEWSEGQIHYIGEGGPGQGAQQLSIPSVVDPRFDSNAISADGSRVFFTEDQFTSGSGAIYPEEGEGPLKVRDVTKEETLRISPGEGLFQGASSDGSRVFYTEAGGLFECALSEVAGKLQCTTVELASGVQGVIGSSEDGSSVYFVSDDALAAGGVPGTCGTAGGTPTQREEEEAKATCGLYVYHAGSTTFIATLSGEDAPDWKSSTTFFESGQSENTFTFKFTARVSPNGRWLAFMSDRSLTGYDNTDATSPAPCGSEKGICDEEVYLYHAPAAGGSGGTGSLTCASCNPTGARPAGMFDKSTSEGSAPLVDLGETWQRRWLAANLPGWTSTYHQSRYLSNQGRLFFNSSDALVPQDVNNAEDVYEYEPPKGAESGAEAPSNDTCTTGSSTYSARSEGCVSLVSSGTSPNESAFLDASEDGDDVFFLSSGELTPQSRGGLSVFDARVGGGEPEPAKPVECQGDACQSAVAAPEDVTPGSLTFHGPGNLTPLTPPPPAKKVTKKTVKCKKNFTKNKKGQCVKRKKSKRAKKSAHTNGRAK